MTKNIEMTFLWPGYDWVLWNVVNDKTFCVLGIKLFQLTSLFQSTTTVSTSFARSWIKVFWEHIILKQDMIYFLKRSNGIAFLIVNIIMIFVRIFHTIISLNDKLENISLIKIISESFYILKHFIWMLIFVNHLK